MNRRQLLALGMVPTVSIIAGCVDNESTGEPGSSQRNSTDDQESDNQEDDDHTDNGSATDTDDRCMDDVHAVIVVDSDVPDEAMVVDLSTERFDHQSTVRRAIEDAVDTANGNGGVTICRGEYEELRDTFEQLSETTESDREQRQPGTIYFDHDGTVAKVILEAND